MFEPLAKLAGAGLIIAALATSAAAQPRPGEEEAQMKVSLAGIDLSSDVGSDSALRRINRAANAFCGVDGSRDLGQIAQARTCAVRMNYLAVRKLDAPLVTARYEKSSAPPIELARR